MLLVKIDPVGLKFFETFIDGGANIFRRPSILAGDM